MNENLIFVLNRHLLSLKGNLETLMGDRADLAIILWLFDANSEEFHTPVCLGLLDDTIIHEPYMRPKLVGSAGIVLKAENIVTSNSPEGATFTRAPFAYRERVESTAAIRIGSEISPNGVLFVNNRQQFSFDTETDELILNSSTILEKLISQYLRRLPSQGEENLPILHEAILPIQNTLANFFPGDSFIWIGDKKNTSPLTLATLIEDHTLKSEYLKISNRYRMQSLTENTIIDVSNKQMYSRFLKTVNQNFATIVPISSSLGHEPTAAVELFTENMLSKGSKTFNDLKPLLLSALSACQSKLRAHTLNRLRQSINLSKTLASSLESVAKYAKELTLADSSIVILTNDSGKLTIGAVWPAGIKEPFFGPPRPNGITEQILEDGSPVIVGDTPLDKRVHPRLRESGIKCLLFEI